MPASDPFDPISQCSDSDSYTQKCRIEISTSSGCRATVTTRNPFAHNAATNFGSGRQWICNTTSVGSAFQSESDIECRARCGTWYAVPNRCRTHVLPARGVLTTAIRSGASIRVAARADVPTLLTGPSQEATCVLVPVSGGRRGPPSRGRNGCAARGSGRLGATHPARIAVRRPATRRTPAPASGGRSCLLRRPQPHRTPYLWHLRAGLARNLLS